MIVKTQLQSTAAGRLLEDGRSAVQRLRCTGVASGHRSLMILERLVQTQGQSLSPRLVDCCLIPSLLMSKSTTSGYHPTSEAARASKRSLTTSRGSRDSLMRDAALRTREASWLRRLQKECIGAKDFCSNSGNP
jgi:hypothetical protein